MNGPQPRLPDAWSYSAWSDYDLCPLKYHGRKVLKLAEPPSAALEDGNKFHHQVAAHVSQGGPLPERPIHKNILPLVAQIRDMEDKVVEQQWGFTSQWKPTGWFTKGAKATWLRAVLDVGIVYEDQTATVVDWKTGKRYSSNDDQMELFAAVTFSYFPHLVSLETRLLYVDSGQEEQAEFNRSELPGLIDKWEGRARTMLSDRDWKPKPNDKCHFCVRARQNGGDCKFG
jgi:hypothetical protein